MRHLLYIPVIHSQVDMGSMAPELKERYVEIYGAHRWRQHQEAVEQMWTGIERRIGAQRLDFHKTLLYQDGLPVCGKELEIARVVASRGSRNYQLVMKLVEQGATLMGTEDPHLLIKEYRYLKVALQEERKGPKWWRAIRDKLHSRWLLKQRDQFIAQRINETLTNGQTGLLFIGMEHRLDQYLPKDLAVSYLFFRLPFRQRGPF